MNHGWKSCVPCGGTGRGPCQDCGGAGDQLDIDPSSLKRHIYKLCSRCDGGRTDRCDRCRGSGRVPKSDFDLESEGQLSFLSEGPTTE